MDTNSQIIYKTSRIWTLGNCKKLNFLNLLYTRNIVCNKKSPLITSGDFSFPNMK